MFSCGHFFSQHQPPSRCDVNREVDHVAAGPSSAARSAGIQLETRHALCALALFLPRGRLLMALRCALATTQLVAPVGEVAPVAELAEAILLVIFAHAGLEVGGATCAAASLAVAIGGCLRRRVGVGRFGTRDRIQDGLVKLAQLIRTMRKVTPVTVLAVRMVLAHDGLEEWIQGARAAASPRLVVRRREVVEVQLRVLHGS